jgi:RluA family pseudouridine synthase
MELKILFEDKYLLAVDKPSGINSDGVYGVQQLVRNYLNTVPYGNKLIAGMPHRLDKPVSGVLLFAKKRQTLKELNKQFADRTVQKTYRAIVEGILQLKQNKLNHFLRIDKENKKAIIKNHYTNNYYPVELSYRVLTECDNTSLIEVELHTGKFHQIRAQLSYIGHPVIGDIKYGAKINYINDSSIALHACKLAFMHPVNNMAIEITSQNKNFNQLHSIV